MNIEELSKGQLLLLTVMVNFIVSIATGILTVSLLDQAPIQVSQGVDRVVERTIQAVAAPTNPITNPIKTLTSVVAPTPAPPSQEDLMTAAVSNVAARTVLIYKDSTTTPAIAYGTYLPTQKSVVTATVTGLPKQAIIAFSDGSSQQASLSKASDAVTIYGFANSATLPAAPAAGLTASTSLKQGQTVIALTKDSAAVTGIISKVDASGIQTSLAGVPVGSCVVGLDGAVLGIGSPTAGVLISADSITTLLQAPASTQ